MMVIVKMCGVVVVIMCGVLVVDSCYSSGDGVIW